MIGNENDRARDLMLICSDRDNCGAVASIDDACANNGYCLPCGAPLSLAGIVDLKAEQNGQDAETILIRQYEFTYKPLQNSRPERCKDIGTAVTVANYLLWIAPDAEACEALKLPIEHARQRMASMIENFEADSYEDQVRFCYRYNEDYAIELYCQVSEAASEIAEISHTNQPSPTDGNTRPDKDGITNEHQDDLAFRLAEIEDGKAENAAKIVSVDRMRAEIEKMAHNEAFYKALEAENSAMAGLVYAIGRGEIMPEHLKWSGIDLLSASVDRWRKWLADEKTKGKRLAHDLAMAMATEHGLLASEILEAVAGVLDGLGNIEAESAESDTAAEQIRAIFENLVADVQSCARDAAKAEALAVSADG